MVKSHDLLAHRSPDRITFLASYKPQSPERVFTCAGTYVVFKITETTDAHILPGRAVSRWIPGMWNYYMTQSTNQNWENKQRHISLKKNVVQDWHQEQYVRGTRTLTICLTCVWRFWLPSLDSLVSVVPWKWLVHTLTKKKKLLEVKTSSKTGHLTIDRPAKHQNPIHAVHEIIFSTFSHFKHISIPPEFDVRNL